MQAAFTKKTQEIATTRKEAEAWKAKADQFDQYSQYLPIVQEMLKQPAIPAAQSPEMIQLEHQLRQQGYDDQTIELMKMTGGFLLNQFQQREAQRDAQAQFEYSIAQAADVDPRLNDASLVYTGADGTQTTFGNIVAGLTKSFPNWQQDPVSATKQAIAMVDAMLVNAKTEGKQELSASAQAKAGRFGTPTSSPQSAAPSGKAVSMQEAADMARKQLGM